MPLYEYRCQKCGQVTEALQKFSDEPLKSCPECSGCLKKLISRSSFQLKGSGWYLTDYARKKMPAKDTSEVKETKKEKTETKPAKKD